MKPTAPFWGCAFGESAHDPVNVEGDDYYGRDDSDRKCDEHPVIGGIGEFGGLLCGHVGGGDSGDDADAQESAKQDASADGIEESQCGWRPGDVGTREDERRSCSGEYKDQQISPEEPEPLRVERDADRFAEINHGCIDIGGPPGDSEQDDGELEGCVGALVMVGFAHGGKFARVPVFKPVGLGLHALQDGEDEGYGAGSDECHGPEMAGDLREDVVIRRNALGGRKGWAHDEDDE